MSDDSKIFQRLAYTPSIHGGLGTLSSNDVLFDSDLKQAFTYKPWTEEQQARGGEVRDALMGAYRVIINQVEPGPMRTRALNMLTDCRMLANQAITFPGN